MHFRQKILQSNREHNKPVPKKTKQKRVEHELFTHSTFLDLYDIRLRDTVSPYIKSINLPDEKILVDTRVYSDRGLIRVKLEGSKVWEDYDRILFIQWIYQRLGKPFNL